MKKDLVSAILEASEQKDGREKRMVLQRLLDAALTTLPDHPRKSMDEDGHCTICGCEIRGYEGGTDDEAVVSHCCPPGFSR